MTWPTSSPPSTPPRKRTRARLVIGIVFGGAALAGALLLFGVYPRETVRRLAEAELRRAVGPRSQLGSLRLTPGALRGEALGLVVWGDGYRLEIPKARFALAPAGLLRARLALRSLELIRPIVVLTDPEGSASPHGPEPASRLPATVESLRVEDARLVVDYARLGGRLEAASVRLRGSVGNGPLEVEAEHLSWDRQTPLAFGPLTARLSVSPGLEVQVERLKVSTPGSWVTLAGAVGPVDAPDLDLRLEASLDAREAALFGFDGVIGRLMATARVAGTLSTLRAEVQASSPSLEWAGTRIQGLQVSLTHEATAGTRAGARGRLGEGELRAEGHLARGEVRVHAEAEDVSLAHLPGFSGVATSGTVSGEVQAQGPWEGVVPLTARLSASGVEDTLRGRGRVQASAWGTVQPSRGTGQGRFSLELAREAANAGSSPGVGGVQVKAAGTVQAGASLHVAGRMSGRAEYRRPDGVATHLPVSGSFLLSDDAFSAEVLALEASALRLVLRSRGDFVERLEAHADDLDLQPLLGRDAGTVALDADLRGPWARLTGNATAQFRKLQWNGSELGDAAVRIALRDGSGDLELSAPSLAVEGQATLQRVPEGGTSRCRLRLTSRDLAEMAPLVGSRVPAEVLRGPLSLQAEFDLPPDGRTIEIESAEAEVDGVRARLRGRLGRGGGPSDLTVRLDADLARLSAPPPWRLEGSLSVDTRLRGTVDVPLLDGTAEATGIHVRYRDAGPALLDLPTGQIRMAGDRVEWNAIEAGLAGGSVTTEGSFSVSALSARPPPAHRGSAASARVHLAWRDVGVGPLLAATAAAPGPASLEASLTGELLLEGTGSDPARWTGRLALEPLQARAAGLDLRLDGLKVALAEGTASLSPFRLEVADQALTGSGRVDLRQGSLEGSLQGGLDLRAVAAVLSPATSLQGQLDLDLRVGGTLEAPRPDGSLSLRDVSVRTAAFPHPLTDLQGRVVLAGLGLRLEGGKARLGGGELEASGTARLDGLALSAVELDVSGRDLALRYPLDFKSRIGASLRLSGEPGAFRLGGQVVVERGLYDRDIFLEDAVLRGAPPAAAAEELPPWMRTVALDLEVRAADRIVVRNNLAQLTVRGSAEVRGDLAFPAPYGRFELGEGGLVFLQTRRFSVDRGTLVFEGSLDPEVDLRAESVIRQVGEEDVLVTVGVAGPLRKPGLTLTSDPTYSEREIASLIATGRRGVSLDSSAWVAGEQLATLLAGRLTRNLARGLMDLGLDEVDLQPELLAREADPGARFTFGKNLSPRAKLVYSVGLNDPDATYFLGEYRVRVGAEATARVQRDDQGEYTYGLGQRFRFGGGERRRRGRRSDLRTEIERLDFVGHLGLSEGALREAAHTEAGDTVSPWALQEDAERLESKLVSAGHIEALVSARAEGKVARFEVEAGARYEATVRGLEDPPDLQPVLRAARSEGEALARGRERLLEETDRRGFPHARVQGEVEGDGERRTLTFEVEPGRRVDETRAEFPGARAVSPKKLREATGGAAAILRDPEAARRAVRKAYRQEHYLMAEAGHPEGRESSDGRQLTVRLPVREGSRARVASVGFAGAEAVSEAELRPLADLEVGGPYDPSSLAPAVERLRDLYLKRGYGSVRVAPRVSAAGADYEVVFEVAEGEARTVGSIVVTGQRRTRESVIRSRLEVKSGEALDPRRLVVSERRILELNVFSRVSVTASEDEPATVTVQVIERGPYTAAYDVRYNDLDRVTAVLDLEAGNLAGRAFALGARVRQGSDLREMRASLSLPVLGRTRGFLATVFHQEEEFLLVREATGGEAAPPAFRDTERQQGFELQQSVRLGNKWDGLYGYRFRRVSSLATGFDQDVSSLGVSLLRETRDNPLDARRGRFWSLSFDLAPKQLGSDLAFFRVYGQAFFIRALSPSWTWAQAYRLGLANGLREKQGEQVQILGRSTELFRAGGASSLRGFATDSVGPKGPIAGLSRGGEAVLVLNQEIRYHHPSGFGAAAFYDVGNVYPRIGDIDLDLRHSLGLGLRYASPLGLLRVDFGFPLNRREGERSYQWFVTLGQAF